jgi:hypothetical protein
LSTIALVPLRPWATPPAGEGGPAADAVAQKRLDALLATLGGRATWAALRGLRNDSQQNRIEQPSVARSVIGIDFLQSRFRIDTRAEGLRLVRVVDGGRHWRLARSGAVEPIPPDTLAQDRRWFAGHVYRTLHRLAAQDAALSVRAVAPRRLEVFEGAGSSAQRLAWFDLDAAHEPYAFGAHDDNEGTLCGPWAFVEKGLHHPVWTARRDGSWRAWLRALEIDPVWPARHFDEPGTA